MLAFAFTSRSDSKEPACLPPAAGLLAELGGLSAVLSAPQNPADHMGAGHGQLLPPGVDGPDHGPSGHLCLPQTCACAKAIFFNAGDGKSLGGN